LQQANPFRVENKSKNNVPGLSLRSNPGLKLANAFGVTETEPGLVRVVISQRLGVIETEP